MNRALSSLHGGSFKIMLTVPLILASMSLIWRRRPLIFHFYSFSLIYPLGKWTVYTIRLLRCRDCNIQMNTLLLLSLKVISNQIMLTPCIKFYLNCLSCKSANYFLRNPSWFSDGKQRFLLHPLIRQRD